MQIGVHKVTCGCITSPQVDKMLAGETVRVLYSDPPWGDGNLNYWKTIKKRMDGVDAPQIHEQDAFPGQ